MKNELRDYVFLDGMWLQDKQLLKLAMNVGSLPGAEHYLCALLADAVIKGRREAIVEVNKVREHYGVKAIPLGKDDLQEDDDLQGKTRMTAADEQAKRLFLKMTEEERLEVLRKCMGRLIKDYHLFIYARHWLGVFLVIRDRLEGDSLKMKDFIGYANDIMPLDWPMTLKMGLNTYKNFGREIDFNDKGEAYYDMENCPQKELCDTLWDIIKQMILTTV